MAKLTMLWMVVLVQFAASAAEEEVEIIWRPPPPPNEDVGLYDPFTEWCCHGNAVPRPRNPSAWQCCDQKLCPIDLQTSQCCQGSPPYQLPFINASCVFDLDCCNGVTFDKTTQRCCNNVVRDIPTIDVDPVDNMGDDCDDVVVVVLPLAVADWQCCGDVLINTAEQVCCNDQPISTDIQFAACCNLNVFDPRTESCCYDNQIDGQQVVPGGIGKWCCGTATYSSVSQLCCSQWNSTSSVSTYEVIDIQSDFDGCCGLSIYNYATHICCWEDSTIVAKPPGSDVNSYFGCCGGQPLDYQRQGCCGAQLYDLNCNKGCCGSTLYDVTVDQLCCWSNELGSQVLVDTKGDKNARCCGGKAYHPSFQLCCNEKIIDLRIRWIRQRGQAPPLHEELRLDFDPDGKGDHCDIWIRLGAYACCGDREYRRDTQRCCGVNIFEADEYPIEFRCCSNDMYQPHRELCCNGQVLKKGLNEDAQCCYSWCSGDCNYWPIY